MAIFSMFDVPEDAVRLAEARSGTHFKPADSGGSWLHRTPAEPPLIMCATHTHTHTHTLTQGEMEPRERERRGTGLQFNSGPLIMTAFHKSW